MEHEQLLRRLYDSFKSVHNYGARLYNEGQHAQAVCLYQGALMVAMQALADRPELMYIIADGLTEVEQSSANLQVKAFRLHEVLDQVRALMKETLFGKPGDSGSGLN